MKQLYSRFNLSNKEIKDIERVKRRYPMKVNSYYLSLIKEKNDPIWKQCIPSIEELNDTVNEEDPLHEESHTPVPFLVHRYPDRALFLVSNKCAMYCRFCTRKRKVGRQVDITKEHLLNAMNYIKDHKEIRDVIVSGGDPLMLKDSLLEFILKKLRAIEHVEIIRIGTRVPCSLPTRVTKHLCNILKRYHPLYMNLHFEHPLEITPESSRACKMLAEAGIPLGNQCIVLKGVNDSPEVMKELFHRLLKIRVKPYYMYQADQVKGTDHFRTSVQEGMDIIENLTGFTSGLCIPQYIIDSYGGGKIPVLPDYVQYKNREKIILKNFEGKIIEYTNPRIKTEKTEKDALKIAVVFNLKKFPEKDIPDDFYAEFDEITVPQAIKQALEKQGHYAELVEADEDFYEKMKAGNYDFVFNIAEGLHGESRESQIPAILEMLKIPYTGSGILTQAVTLDKKRTKEILLYHGIATPKYQLFAHWNQKIDSNLSFPLIVKPNAEGSSKGIKNNSLVFNEEELKERVRTVIKDYKQPALAEEFLEGREFTVGIIGNNPPRVLPIVEITFDYLPEGIQKFDSYEVKWYWDNPNNPIDPIVCPAKITRDLERKIKNTALKAYAALGCVDLCRMDLRLDNRGTPNVIDVNALPGLMPDPKENSRFPKSCFTAGMSYDEIINTVFNEAVKRNGLATAVKKVQLNANSSNI
ncbi:KamA family radical SAM protein [Candidatus Woesearchaeota archaeon]|nr:KamA family radical SAM protein [Candidatus Woesearchaeota archaeon]